MDINHYWVLAIFGIREIKSSQQRVQAKTSPPELTDEDFKTPWIFYLTPLAISCSQGILFFELPLIDISQKSIMTSGLLFSIVSIGALVTLSLLFLQRYSPYLRTLYGGLLLAFIFFVMAVQWPIPLSISLFVIGMAKGIIYPAMATFLASITKSTHYGRVFAMMSISFSIGAFLGPILAGQLRDAISSYYIAFIVLMTAITFLPFCQIKPPSQSKSVIHSSIPTFPGK